MKLQVVGFLIFCLVIYDVYAKISPNPPKSPASARTNDKKNAKQEKSGVPAKSSQQQPKQKQNHANRSGSNKPTPKPQQQQKQPTTHQSEPKLIQNPTEPSRKRKGDNSQEPSVPPLNTKISTGNHHAPPAHNSSYTQNQQFQQSAPPSVPSSPVSHQPHTPDTGHVPPRVLQNPSAPPLEMSNPATHAGEPNLPASPPQEPDYNQDPHSEQLDKNQPSMPSTTPIVTPTQAQQTVNKGFTSGLTDVVGILARSFVGGIGGAAGAVTFQKALDAAQELFPSNSSKVSDASTSATTVHGSTGSNSNVPKGDNGSTKDSNSELEADSAQKVYRDSSVDANGPIKQPVASSSSEDSQDTLAKDSEASKSSSEKSSAANTDTEPQPKNPSAMTENTPSEENLMNPLEKPVLKPENISTINQTASSDGDNSTEESTSKLE